MTALMLLTDDELLQRMAVYNNSCKEVSEIRHEIYKRISKKSTLTSHDIALVNWLIEKAQEIEDNDLDLIDSSKMDKLNKQYAELKRQALGRMDGQDHARLIGAVN